MFECLWEVKPEFLRRHRTHHLFVSVDHGEFRYGRDVEVKPMVVVVVVAAAADVAYGPYTFRIRQATASSTATAVLSFVVAPFVAAESLTGRKRFVTDGTNVRFDTCSAADGGYRGGLRVFISSA